MRWVHWWYWWLDWWCQLLCQRLGCVVWGTCCIGTLADAAGVVACVFVMAAIACQVQALVVGPCGVDAGAKLCDRMKSTSSSLSGSTSVRFELMLGDDGGLLSSLDEDVRGKRLPRKLLGIIWSGLSGTYPTSRNSCSSIR